MTSPPKKTKKSSKSKLIDEPKEGKKEKSKSSEKAASKELEKEVSEPISEQKVEEKEVKAALSKIGMILNPYTYLISFFFFLFFLNYHCNTNILVCF